MTGVRLIRLLLFGGWEIVRDNPHGCWMKKVYPDRTTRFTTVKNTRERIPQKTLAQILGTKQTGLGAQGLRDLDRCVK